MTFCTLRPGGPPPSEPPPTGGGHVGFWRATGIPYSPGVYVLANPETNDIAATLTDILSDIDGSPHIDGLSWRQNWNEVETGAGTYDWSEIRAALATTKAAGLKFSLDITIKTFVNDPPVVPAWLQAAHGGDGYTYAKTLYANGTQATCAIVWDRGTAASNAVRAAWFDLWDAFAAEFSTEWADFGWITTHESASSIAVGDSGFTHQGFTDYIVELIGRWRAASATAPWVSQINYIGGATSDYLDQIVDACVANTVFLGGPDIKIGGAQEQASYSRFREIYARDPVPLPVFHDVQWSNFVYNSPYLRRVQTMDDITNYCSGGTAGGHAGMHLQALNFRDRTPYWPDDVLAAAAKYHEQFPVEI